MTRGLFGLHGARHLDGAAEQEQFLRQGGFAGVRVRNDRESPAPGDFFAEFRHDQVDAERRAILADAKANSPGEVALLQVPQQYRPPV